MHDSPLGRFFMSLGEVLGCGNVAGHNPEVKKGFTKFKGVGMTRWAKCQHPRPDSEGLVVACYGHGQMRG